MQALPTQKSFLQRQIPTILGLTILVIALGVGLVFFSQGLGVFTPRATPQTTPKSIKISNVTDNSFTISFMTDEAVAGFIKYGTEANNLKSQASDDRDQLSGNVGDYTLHHVTVRGLEANKAYFYTLGTGSGAVFDNNGVPFTLTTAKRSGTPSAAKTIYGSVSNENNSPSEGSIVYITLAGVGEMSSLVKSSGSWATPLSNARTADGSGYATIADTDALTLTVQGPKVSQKLAFATTVAEAQPAPNLTFGQTPTANAPKPSVSPTPVVAQPSPTPISLTTSSATSSSTVSTGGINNLLGSTATSSATASSSGVVDLQKTTPQTVTTGQPLIIGKASPGVAITISVHSEVEITQQLVADSQGGFSLDIAALGQELEPGEHTVTYSYVDPSTQQTVTKTQTFTVSATANQLALASTSPSPVPFGSGNPFPVGGATNSGVLSSPISTTSASPSPSPTSTTSARVSIPSTSSGIPVSGSTATTLALLAGGLFFILAGSWSFWVAQQLEHDTL